MIDSVKVFDVEISGVIMVGGRLFGNTRLGGPSAWASRCTLYVLRGFRFTRSLSESWMSWLAPGLYLQGMNLERLIALPVNYIVAWYSGIAPLNSRGTLFCSESATSLGRSWFPSVKIGRPDSGDDSLFLAWENEDREKCRKLALRYCFVGYVWHRLWQWSTGTEWGCIYLILGGRHPIPHASGKSAHIGYWSILWLRERSWSDIRAGPGTSNGFRRFELEISLTKERYYIHNTRILPLEISLPRPASLWQVESRSTTPLMASIRARELSSWKFWRALSTAVNIREIFWLAIWTMTIGHDLRFCSKFLRDCFVTAGLGPRSNKLCLDIETPMKLDSESCHLNL